MITILIRSPRSVVTLAKVDNKFPYPIILLQRGYCTLVIILLGRFYWVVHQPDGVHTSTFPKPTTTLGLVEQAFWRVPPFTK